MSGNPYPQWRGSPAGMASRPKSTGDVAEAEPAQPWVRAVCNDARRRSTLLPHRCGRPRIPLGICNPFLKNGFRMLGHPRTSTRSSFYAGYPIFTLSPDTANRRESSPRPLSPIRSGAAPCSVFWQKTFNPLESPSQRPTQPLPRSLLPPAFLNGLS